MKDIPVTRGPPVPGEVHDWSIECPGPVLNAGSENGPQIPSFPFQSVASPRPAVDDGL